MPKGDSFLDNPFGGLFDFDGNGKEDLGEQWVGFQILEEDARKEDAIGASLFDDDYEDHSWRQFCEDGSEYGIYPEEYETEEEYVEALEKAKYGWRDTAEDGLEFGVDPEDYETEEEYNEALEEARYGWRDTAEDGLEFGVDPEDYETEEEYEEALEEAKYGWRDTAEDGSEFGVDPEDYETEEEYEEALESARSECDNAGITLYLTIEADESNNEETIKAADYPNKRQYQAAVTLAGYDGFPASDEYAEKERSRCQFIVEQRDKFLAANYLTADGDFLFSQAIKDHFDLPVTLPDEDENSELLLCEILKKIQKKNVTLALRVWDWCVEQFLPYADYSAYGRGMLTDNVLGDLYCFSDTFNRDFRVYLNEHPDFRRKIIREAGEMPDGLEELIVSMIKTGYGETAKAMFDDGLFLAEGKWKAVNELMSGLIAWAKDDEELETMEFIEQNFLPKMKQYSDGMILDEVDGWQQEITEYVREVERNSEKYAYSRINAWRKTVPDGIEYGLDPLYYDTEQAYLDALQEEKYGWRKWAAQRDTLGLDPEQFETEEEYHKAWRVRYGEVQAKRREELRRQKTLKSQSEDAELLNDKTIYTYCGVKLPISDRPYCFRTEDDSLKVGDPVIVPIGEDNREMEGTIVSVGQYFRIAVPFPVEKTKFILRRAENQSPKTTEG